MSKATCTEAAARERRSESLLQESVDPRPEPARMGRHNLERTHKTQVGHPTDRPTGREVQLGRHGTTGLDQREAEVWTGDAGLATCKWLPSRNCSCCSWWTGPWKESQTCHHRCSCSDRYHRYCSCRRAPPSSPSVLNPCHSHLEIILQPDLLP